MEGARRVGEETRVMLNLPDWQAIFAPKGRLLREGELIQRLNLSRTLATIAEEGPWSTVQSAIIPSFPPPPR
ncbi:hypothetical protein QCA50_004240 [Cerrena zonata]|uniref:Uncharacterized protein n=1 Tax=Cerrena zonata TaxID=2478898 RepID=A0AAW0GGB3_9APHY